MLLLRGSKNKGAQVGCAALPKGVGVGFGRVIRLGRDKLVLWEESDGSSDGLQLPPPEQVTSQLGDKGGGDVRFWF